MTHLNGRMIKTNELTKQQIQDMFRLMDLFYSHMEYSLFVKDLSDKDYCILLEKQGGELAGFSTQKLLSFPVSGHTVHGVFSGDTIIHKDDWGSPELFLVFARFFFNYAGRYDHFYWFLISKGYKTYKLLPAFFREFYPNFRMETPVPIKNLMDAFGELLYPEEYDKTLGVVSYGKVKDTLRPGVADITANRRRDRDILFFTERNPSYLLGDDLVCIADLKRENLRKGVAERLL